MTALVGNGGRPRLANIKQKVTLVAQVRLIVVLGLFALAITTLLLRLFYYGAFEGQVQRSLVSTDVIPVRADLVDRNGVPLARNMKMRALRVIPEKILGDKNKLAMQLAEIFPDTPASTFLKAMKKDRPSYLRRRLVPEDANKVHALGEVGFEFPREDERFYPQHGLAAHVLGYVDADRKGVMGMEKALEERLVDPAKLAEPAALSIDIRVQAALESELGATMKKHSARGATGVVLDVHTGEVLAMASLPEFNPNKIDATALRHQVNDVTYSVYELGSTFKPLTVAAALDAGTVTNLATRYNATEPLKVGRFRIKDDHAQGRYLNVPEALVHSSNIVTARLADNLGKERMEEMFRKLDFDDRPEIELVEAGRPLWPQNWGRVTNMTVSYGHGIAVTPMHLASAYAALVNGGIWRPATLEKVGPDKADPGRRVFKASTSARIRQLLRMIVSDGTGRKADAPGFRIGGKTGSAEKPKGGGYSKSSLVSTFAAAFPMDDPKYVVITMLDEPKGIAETFGQRTAGWTAAPVVKRLVPRIGPMLGVVPDESRDVDVSELTPLLWRPKGES
ncbi:penicillin-binding protein 2 [Sphingorhabdus sp. Alg239-R122]|uniref:peptidoglycan D,D-transpeptidase FtsI family protein n=1 Tax=Sphingorhabdus sp. Alg239-R122 TaxID=2305989 RepID=UPI0013DC2D8D|nr:penicillin-binding protein 2 [Sphingorhabdus sp. Alg239-R122]